LSRGDRGVEALEARKQKKRPVKMYTEQTAKGVKDSGTIAGLVKRKGV